MPLAHDGPCAIRYPKAAAPALDVMRSPITLGRAEVFGSGHDLTIMACGAVLADCLAAAESLRRDGVEASVINARFVKPLDRDLLVQAVSNSTAVLTVEEAARAGGFGSAVLEAASDEGLGTRHIRRLGVPDRFIEHASRAQLLADLGLDTPGIAAACRRALGMKSSPVTVP